MSIRNQCDVTPVSLLSICRLHNSAGVKVSVYGVIILAGEFVNKPGEFVHKKMRCGPREIHSCLVSVHLRNSLHI